MSNRNLNEVLEKLNASLENKEEEKKEELLNYKNKCEALIKELYKIGAMDLFSTLDNLKEEKNVTLHSYVGKNFKFMYNIFSDDYSICSGYGGFQCQKRYYDSIENKFARLNEQMPEYMYEIEMQKYDAIYVYKQFCNALQNIIDEYDDFYNFVYESLNQLCEDEKTKIEKLKAMSFEELLETYTDALASNGYSEEVMSDLHDFMVIDEPSEELNHASNDLNHDIKVCTTNNIVCVADFENNFCFMTIEEFDAKMRKSENLLKLMKYL